MLELLARSVVFLTPASIETVLGSAAWQSTAWDLASLFLASVGAEPLSSQAPGVVGLSEETTCYVSCEYFRCRDPFADFVVHEAAHIFHNCKRSTIGLTETRTRDWLLPIAFARRETFAWACEAYTRILELGRGPAERRRMGHPTTATRRRRAREEQHLAWPGHAQFRCHVPDLDPGLPCGHEMRPGCPQVEMRGQDASSRPGGGS